MFDSKLGTDASDRYANLNSLYIEFYHLPSDRSVRFKAYITDWNDKFDSSWNSEQVYGRNDQIHTFQGTSREISLSWEVPAASEEESAENMARISVLSQFLYPAFKSQQVNYGTEGMNQYMNVGTMSKAPLIKVAFANVVASSNPSGQGLVDAKQMGLLCAMSGLDISADLDAGVTDGLGLAIPKVFKLSTSLKVLHMHDLGWNNDTKMWMGPVEFPYKAWGGIEPAPTAAAAPAADQTPADPAEPPTNEE